MTNRNFEAFLAEQRDRYRMYNKEFVHAGCDAEQLEKLLFEHTDRQHARKKVAQIAFILNSYPRWMRKYTLFRLYRTSRATYAEFWETYLELDEPHKPSDVLDRIYKQFRKLNAINERLINAHPLLHAFVSVIVDVVNFLDHLFLLLVLERFIENIPLMLTWGEE